MNPNTPSSHKNNEPESSVLYIVGTPIGNLNDLSFRALNILKNVSLIACEDTRQTQKIMSKFKFTNYLISFNKYNYFSKIPKIMNNLDTGKSVALVSDAGMPSICDPGEDLIKKARLDGYKIICIPGPCAVINALVSSGLPCSKFIFEGFLPKNNSERKKLLSELSQNDKTTILYESPHRLKKSLFELKEYCGGDREIIINRELTKKFEEHIGNTIDQVINYFEDKEVLGEITIVIKGIKKTNKNNSYDEDKLREELYELIEGGMALNAASKYLAKKNHIKKSTIYNMY